MLDGFLQELNLCNCFTRAYCQIIVKMSCRMTKPTKTMCAQGRLRSAWVAKDTSFLHADSEDSDQTGHMPFCWFCHEAAQIKFWRILVTWHDSIHLVIHNGDCEVKYTDICWLYLSYVMWKPVMPFANNKGADQPAHPRSLISAFLVCCLDSI